MDAKDLVAVYTLQDPSKAAVIKALLQSEGIHHFIDGENQAGLTGILEMRVMVPAEQADRARKVILSHEP